MALGANFEYMTNLQYKVKSLTRRLEAFESGQRYLALQEEFKKQLAAQRKEINKLKAELARAHREIVRVADNWFQVFEDISDEHQKEIEIKDRMIKKLESQLIKTEQGLDDAKDELRDKNIELYQAKTEIEDLKGVILELKAQINRDYENSSIPSSQKPNHKKITNNREKTGRKPGGQKGHKGHPRKKYKPTGYIFIPAPDKYAHSDNYKPTGRTIKKQLVNLDFTLKVLEFETPEFRDVRTGQRVHADFPAGVLNDVNYGGSIKAAALLLNNRYGVSIDKVREFLAQITDGELKISKGMINGLCREFSAKTEAEQKKAFADMLLLPVLQADFTNARVNGKNAQVAICSGSGITLYFAREHKGHKGLAGTPVEYYHGILVHDHDLVFYSYGDNHQECLVHVLRYLKDSMENESNLQWNKRMRGLLQEMIHYRKGLAEENPELDPDRVKEFEDRYREILELAKREYDYEPPSDYYREGYNLYKRLAKYRDNHLLFLHDVGVPTNNNLCERKGRVFKRKQRQVMAFRSF
ncbi:MAG: transposase, partial [Firmicutes bacterium]|nr:transposase [Bacillota bacterium]